MLSRRLFLTGSAGLIAAGRALTVAAESVPTNRVPRFARPDAVRYDSSAFTIKGRDTFVYSLEFQYPRVRPQEWPDRFAKIRRAGFNAIDTYIFWNYHERAPGHFDFTELESFLRLAHESGLYVIARPGPYVDAEFERGGFPAYVIAKRFPVRSMHPESLRTSQHWYDHVLPVIRRHQVTQGGPIILMQIENEMDFTDVPESEQREYLRFLAQLAWRSGIDVPLISNVSTVVRTRGDADMANILDLCDFYPRWSFLTDNPLPSDTSGMTMEQKVGLSDRAVLASIRKMHDDEPNAPLSVAELGTGYYSKVGGKLAEDEEGADASELNALIKTVISQGITYLNLYLGVGGSNFSWAAKGVTSTYDFSAPIREGGGLSDKYYEAKAVAAALGLFGAALVRSEASTAVARSSNPDMTVYRRDCGTASFLFVRANTDAQHHHRLTFRDAGSDQMLMVPREGQLTLGPRGMKLLPLNVVLEGITLRYSTAELLAVGSTGKRAFIVAYDEPGARVEMSLHSDAADVAGRVEYSAWEEATQSIVVGMRVASQPLAVLVGQRILIVLVPRYLALRTWVDNLRWPEPPRSIDLPWITDAYLMRGAGVSPAAVWADIEYTSGPHSLTTVLSAEPDWARADGHDLTVNFDPATGVTRCELVTETCPIAPIVIRSGRSWIERFGAGAWTHTRGRTLEDMGPIPFGYVKYRARVPYTGRSTLQLRAFTGNDKKVFINGRFVEAASLPEAFILFPTPSWMRPGENTIEVIYELMGSAEFGETARMAELNGIHSLTIGAPGDAAIALSDWEVQTFAAPMVGRRLNPAFTFDGAAAVELSPQFKPPAEAEDSFKPAFAWFTSNFELPAADGLWTAPMRLEVAATRDALLYLNGSFIGRFATAGPQTSFYLPEAMLPRGAQNQLTTVLAYSDNLNDLQGLRIIPDAEFAVRRTRVEFGLRV